MIKYDFKGVIFDLDNTLVSSSLNFNHIRNVVGCPRDRDILSYIDSLPLKEKVNVQKKIHEYEMEDAKSATILPGSLAVLDTLKHLHIPFAVVTRNHKKAAILKIENNHLKVPLLLTRDDLSAKPAPDAVFFLAEYWKIQPKKLLCVGDYLYDIEMANNANALSCLVSYGHELPYTTLATFDVNNLMELRDIIAKSYDVRTRDA